MAITVIVPEAKAQLHELTQLSEQGEEIIIAQSGQPQSQAGSYLAEESRQTGLRSVLR